VYKIICILLPHGSPGCLRIIVTASPAACQRLAPTALCLSIDLALPLADWRLRFKFVLCPAQ